MRPGQSGHLPGRRLPERAVHRHGVAGAPAADGGAERGDLLDGHHRAQPPVEAQAGDDGQRHHRDPAPQQRAEGRQCGDALPADGGDVLGAEPARPGGAAADRHWRTRRTRAQRRRQPVVSGPGAAQRPAGATGSCSAGDTGADGASKATTIDALFAPLATTESRGMVWQYDGNKQLKAVRLRLGATDGTFTEVLNGADVPADAQIVTAMKTGLEPAAKAATGTPSGNPLMGGGPPAAAAGGAASRWALKKPRDKAEGRRLLCSSPFYRSGIADGPRSVIPLRLLLMAKRLSGLTPSGST